MLKFFVVFIVFSISLSSIIIRQHLIDKEKYNAQPPKKIFLRYFLLAILSIIPALGANAIFQIYTPPSKPTPEISPPEIVDPVVYGLPGSQLNKNIKYVDEIYPQYKDNISIQTPLINEIAEPIKNSIGTKTSKYNIPEINKNEFYELNAKLIEYNASDDVVNQVTCLEKLIKINPYNSLYYQQLGRAALDCIVMDRYTNCEDFYRYASISEDSYLEYIKYDDHQDIITVTDCIYLIGSLFDHIHAHICDFSSNIENEYYSYQILVLSSAYYKISEDLMNNSGFESIIYFGSISYFCGLSDSKIANDGELSFYSIDWLLDSIPFYEDAIKNNSPEVLCAYKEMSTTYKKIITYIRNYPDEAKKRNLKSESYYNELSKKCDKQD